MSEEIIMKKLSNHFRKWYYADGGKLLLTNKNLIFHPHKINLPGGKLQIPLKYIKNVKKRTRFGISKQIVIERKDGKKEYFVMWHRDEFLNEINRLLDYTQHISQ